LLDDQYSNDFNYKKANSVLDYEFKEYIAQKMINCQLSKAIDFPSDI